MKILSAFTGRKMTVSYMVDGEEKKKSFSLAHVKQVQDSKMLAQILLLGR